MLNFIISSQRSSSLVPSLRLLLRHSHSLDVFNCNLEIASHGRGGRIQTARKLFDQMPIRDVVSWNAIITGYWQNNDFAESRKLFDLMPQRNIVSWNSMIAACFHNGLVDEALQYFAKMPARNVASYNAMISGFVRFDRMDEAVRIFESMPVRNVISCTAMVDGFARNGDVDKARELFDQMPKKNVVSWTVMISGYVENERFEDARKLFDEMPEKNVTAFTAMITGYCKEGRVNEARRMFDGIKQKDIVSWNAMISGYAHNGYGEEAVKLHIQMVESGMKTDHATLIAVLTSCSALALLHQGKQIHAIVTKTRLDSNISLCNALVTMYSRCGSISDSEAVFLNIPTRDLVSWNTIIAAYAQHGEYQKALAFFHEIEGNGFKPNEITFLSILSACGHAGKVNESLYWIDLMGSKYKIAPRPEHYACLVDTLSRAGQLEKAYEYIKQMPFETEGSVWGALLGACLMHSNVKLGELAAEKLVQLDPQNSGAYVMLSNLYAAGGMWMDVTRIRGVMKEQGAKKQPGYSWTEISDKVHLFLGGDVSHPDILRIHLELRRISLHMKINNDEVFVV
ncbi:putative tetratricopeptide-like helical domain superfamily [Dioscorea sansibarensis]